MTKTSRCNNGEGKAAGFLQFIVPATKKKKNHIQMQISFFTAGVSNVSVDCTLCRPHVVLLSVGKTAAEKPL